MIGYLPDNRLCITQAQLAKILHRDVQILKYYRKKKVIKGHSDGTHIFFIVDEIKDWVKEYFGVDLEKKVKEWLKRKYNW